MGLPTEEYSTIFNEVKTWLLKLKFLHHHHAPTVQWL